MNERDIYLVKLNKLNKILNLILIAINFKNHLKHIFKEFQKIEFRKKTYFNKHNIKQIFIGITQDTFSILS